jgi:hypothetical protein
MMRKEWRMFARTLTFTVSAFMAGALARDETTTAEVFILTLIIGTAARFGWE